jgi:hypothetical protein
MGAMVVSLQVPLLCHIVWDGLELWGKPCIKPEGGVLLLSSKAVQWPGLSPEMKVLSVPRRLTPASALHFLSVSLPAPALVHKHQCTLLHMVYPGQRHQTLSTHLATTLRHICDMARSPP